MFDFILLQPTVKQIIEEHFELHHIAFIPNSRWWASLLCTDIQECSITGMLYWEISWTDLVQFHLMTLLFKAFLDFN